MRTGARNRARTQRPKLPPGWQKALLTAAAIVVLGCGDKRPARVPVSGQVLIDGQPLTSGNIKFVPEGARASAGKLDAQGRFTLTCYDGEDGVVPGRHRAQISAMEVISASKVKWLAPPKYADFRTSGLEFEITEPTEDMKVNLTWGGSPPGKPFVQ
jgi:hypothetical protein